MAAVAGQRTAQPMMLPHSILSCSLDRHLADPCCSTMRQLWLLPCNCSEQSVRVLLRTMATAMGIKPKSTAAVPCAHRSSVAATNSRATTAVLLAGWALPPAAAAAVRLACWVPVLASSMSTRPPLRPTASRAGVPGDRQQVQVVWVLEFWRLRKQQLHQRSTQLPDEPPSDPQGASPHQTGYGRPTWFKRCC